MLTKYNYKFQSGDLTNENQLECYSTHLTQFSGGWTVAPNVIDFNYVFSNLDFFSNPTLYITEILIAIVYIIGAVWARHKDKQDVTKVRLNLH